MGLALISIKNQIADYIELKDAIHRFKSIKAREVKYTKDPSAISKSLCKKVPVVCLIFKVLPLFHSYITTKGNKEG